MSQPLEIVTFLCGPFATDSYLVRSGGVCWVIDPGYAPAELVARLPRDRLTPRKIILTHGHCDHIAGIEDVRSAAGAVPLCCPAADAGMLTDPRRNLSAGFGMPLVAPPADELLRPGGVLELGETRWEVLDTSGHTDGGVSLYCRQEGVIFTGDALFAEGIGRTDLPGGDAARLIANIRRQLLTLPPETRIYPGHGPLTTVGRERQYNPFVADSPGNQ